MKKEEYINFLKNEISKAIVTTGFPAKHSILYTLVNDKETRSLIEYNKGTKNLWVSEVLTEHLKQDIYSDKEFMDKKMIDTKKYNQFTNFIHECFSEALGVKIKNCYDVNLKEIVGF